VQQLGRSSAAPLQRILHLKLVADPESELETFGFAEGANDRGGVLVLRVDGVVEAAHVGGGEFASEIREGGTQEGKFFESGASNNRDGVVGREIVTVVVQSDEAKGIDQAIRRIAGDDVHLMINEGAIDEAEVHDARLAGEMESVAVAPATETVGALEEFVADADAPFGSKRCDIRDFLQVEVPSVVAADNHGERIFEAEGFGDFEVEALSIELPDAVVGGGGIASGRLAEDGGQGGAGVLDVEVKLAGQESFVDKEGTAKVGFADDGNTGTRFDMLREKLGEDDLFSEEFGADGDARLLWRTARGKKEKEK
jgi:hypothetical protein